MSVAFAMPSTLPDPFTPAQATCTMLARVKSPVAVTPTIQIDRLLREVLAMLSSDRALPGVLVFEQERFVRLLSRTALTREMSQPNFLDLFSNRPIRLFLRYQTAGTLVLDGQTDISAAIEQAMAREPAQRYEPIVVREGDDLRLVDIHDMLNTQCRALTDTLAELEQQRRAAREAEHQRQKLQEEFAVASRQAGMAQIASNILHNVGNVLNSVTISASLVAEKLTSPRVTNLQRAAGMLRDHRDDLATYLSSDERGRQLPDYLAKAGEVLGQEQQAMLDEVKTLQKSIEHITHIVGAQQAYASGAVAVQPFDLTEVAEDALRMSALAFERHRITVQRVWDGPMVIEADKHLVMQVVVNLITNAKAATRDSGRDDKRITVAVSSVDSVEGPHAQLTVEDNGVGIAPENLPRIFTQGFTTRRDGHGLGLHNAANAVVLQHGRITVHSDGVGKGARFVLDVPLTQPQPPETAPGTATLAPSTGICSDTPVVPTR